MSNAAKTVSTSFPATKSDLCDRCVYTYHVLSCHAFIRVFALLGTLWLFRYKWVQKYTGKWKILYKSTKFIQKFIYFTAIKWYISFVKWLDIRCFIPSSH